MRILYYTWAEANAKDVEECLKERNNIVDKISFPIKDKLNDIPFANYMGKLLEENVYDCIFTFDFFPIISKVAYAYGVKYISWVYDSPNLTLYSKAVFNECNFIFSFDRAEVIKLKAYGVQHIYHMPLAVNTKRLEAILQDKWNKKRYCYDVTFLGNLYSNEYNFYDQIKNIPEYYKGFFEAIIKTQMNLYGVDLASQLITEERYREIKKFVPIQLDDEIFAEEKDIFCGFLHKKITAMERKNILKEVSEKYAITHFASEQNPELVKVDFQGYADYITKMPCIFCESKINLNITLRSIISGIPLRCLDVMGAGGFLLSNYQPELAEYFVEGEEMVVYQDTEDLMDKIEYYLAHDKEREEIANQGKRKIEKEFTYENQLEKMFAIVFED